MNRRPPSDRAAVSIVRGADGAAETDAVTVEEPLEIRVDGEPLAVLMRTPGSDEALVAGFLLTEGVIEDRSDLRALAPCADPNRPAPENVYLVQLAEGCPPPDPTRRRHFGVSASCGLCGKTTIESIHQHAPPLEAPTPVEPTLPARAAALARPRQHLFAATGGCHAAMLLGPERDRPVLAFAEDVGRHNALDKVLGTLLLADALPAEGAVLWLSGRASFEMVQKALVARVGAIVCVGAPSSLAVDLARTSRMTLVGFAAGSERFNVYSGALTTG